MISKPKKTRILSLSIIDKAIQAIEEKPADRLELLNTARKYNMDKVFEYYDETINELEYEFKKRKADFEKINTLYITRERLYRILNPTIYLNAYKEKRANDAIYINANVGFIDDKGKVKNVVVFMGKSAETDLGLLKQKIESDESFIEDAKQKVIEKLLTKIEIPELNFSENSNRRRLKLDVKPELNLISESMLKKMKGIVQEIDVQKESNDPQILKKSLGAAQILISKFLDSLEEFKKYE